MKMPYKDPLPLTSYALSHQAKSSRPPALYPLTFLFLLLKASSVARSWKGIQSGVPSPKTPNSGRKVHVWPRRTLL